MALPIGIIEEFEHVTRFNLTSYLSSYVTLINSHRRNILDYYSGRVSEPNEPSFRALNKLLKQSRDLNDLIDIHNNRLRSGSFWELCELLSNIFTTLLTIENSSKWLRSAITKNNFSPTVETTYVSTDRDKDWIRIALRNDLSEEGYNHTGGNNLQITGQNTLTLRLFSVVDNISGKKVYGLDIDRKLTYLDDDLKALSYEETIKQAFEILCTLKQGSTPEFPQNGIQGNLTQGTNINSVSYPVIFRQIYQTFQQDDTFKALSITKIETKQDALFVSLNAETRLSDIIEQNINISI